VRAGKVAYDLHDNFIKNGYESKMLTKYLEKEENEVICMFDDKQWKRHQLKRKVIRKIIEPIKLKLGLKKRIKTNNKYQFFEPDESIQYFTTRNIIKRLKGYKPNVIVVLFTTHFLNVKNIHDLASYFKVPVIWHMLDMAPITGGCHYSWECEGYKENCGSCPALNSNNPNDLSRKNLEYKRKYIKGIDLRMMSGSTWDNVNTAQSNLFKNVPLYSTVLTFDPEVFKPSSHRQFRSKYNINDNSIVIFFGAVHFAEERKGMNHLLEALKILEKRLEIRTLESEVVLLIAGETSGFGIDKLPFNYVDIGYLNDVDELAEAYNAADVFVCPSVYDSGPVMVSQSLMSGTPIVSFEMGLALDFVHNEKTGYRAKLKDSYDLAEGLYRMVSLSKEQRMKMSENCRDLALKMLHPDKIIKDYQKVFDEIEQMK